MVLPMDFLYTLWYPKGNKKNWPKCHSGQSVTDQSVTSQSDTGQTVSPDKLSLRTNCLWPMCLWILDLGGISFHSVVVFGVGKVLLFKFVLGHCVLLWKSTTEFPLIFWVWKISTRSDYGVKILFTDHFNKTYCSVVLKQKKILFLILFSINLGLSKGQFLWVKILTLKLEIRQIFVKIT